MVGIKKTKPIFAFNLRTPRLSYSDQTNGVDDFYFRLFKRDEWTVRILEPWIRVNDVGNIIKFQLFSRFSSITPA